MSKTSPSTTLEFKKGYYVGYTLEDVIKMALDAEKISGQHLKVYKHTADTVTLTCYAYDLATKDHLDSCEFTLRARVRPGGVI